MDLAPVERELSYQQALDNLKQWLAKQNIQASLRTSDDKRVAHVQFTTSAGRPLALGSGKGPGAIVGAYFEALEHMMLEHHYRSSHTELLPLTTWRDSKQCHQHCLFSQALQEYQDELVTFHGYRSLYSQQRYLIPEVLINPFHVQPLLRQEAFFFLQRYTSNSGWASGSTFEEAVLHGANEQIERHYLSEMYKQYIGFKEYTGEFLAVVPPTALVQKYRSYFDEIEKLNVVLCETQFGSYFCACIIPSAISPMASRASGVSYSQYHAIERAMSELAQSLENYDGQALKQDINAADFLNSYDKLSPLTVLSELDRLPCLDLSQLPPDNAPFKHHYEALNHGIQTQGYDLLVHTAFHQDDIWLTSTYIPGLERFNIIDKGIWVVPLGTK
jgi:ribosomal protein S12 methylthiotransferase accessory factor YcaO